MEKKEKKEKKETRERGRVLRLAKPVRKGVLGLVFSRLLIIVLLVLMQVFIILGFFRWLGVRLPHFALIKGVVTVIGVLYLFNNRMDNSAKLTWMMLIALFPVPGVLLLLYTQADTGHRRIARRIAALTEETKNAIPQDGAVLEALADGSGTDELRRYINRSGCFPVFGGTEARYFSQAEELFPVMLEELEKAEKFIFLEFFIIEEGYMWGRVLDVLARKAAAGLDVRVMFDGMCETFHLPHDYVSRLEKLGIRAKSYQPLRPLFSTRYNYRDHRKILVVDGAAAFTGGVNLADEYINRTVRFGHWKDNAVLLRGEAARSFTLMFLQMWNINEKHADFSPAALPAPPVPEAQGFVMPYADCPLSGSKVGEGVYIDMLYRAERYVHIMTPYLVLDGRTEAALKYAAERGIDVKIILPGVPDKKIAWAIAKSHYRTLLRAGVQLYEYTPGFVHAKSFVSDGRKAVVGTINLDYRSLYHHFECAAYLYKTPCVADVEADFQATIEKCRAVTEESIKAEKFLYKIGGRIIKLVAPLL